ncbi:MAG: DUF763 domain-containing protein [Thaumarchaeota archaeon]|nr:MAG: DUF763 domain-containing protein [Nitrososphaerota archaeon]HDD42720.1 DUF763 domain-containing protein [Nitrososphaeria archaeon]
MKLSGVSYLPLHGGKAPAWLMARMKPMAAAIAKVIVEDYGRRELLRRISDPYWFQSFGCALGFDWHSSGLTTTVVGALREALRLDEHGVAVAGGKGIMSKRIPERLTSLGLDEDKVFKLLRASRLTAKVDNAVLQDGYQIYHHAIIFTEEGDWAVIQQGMNPDRGYARRYHWLGERVECFVVEPHSGIASAKREGFVLNMVSRRSEEARRASVDLVSENPSRLVRMINLISRRQETLTAILMDEKEAEPKPLPSRLEMPRRIDWKAVKRAYDLKPKNYEELVEIRGIGPSTLRALALVSALIYGVRIDWRDPVKFTFAVGGKDGVPYPVSRRTYDQAISFMQQVLEEAEIGREEKKAALRRLLSLERRMYG